MSQENYTPMGKERQKQWEAIMKLGKQPEIDKVNLAEILNQLDKAIETGVRHAENGTLYQAGTVEGLAQFKLSLLKRFGI